MTGKKKEPSVEDRVAALEAWKARLELTLATGSNIVVPGPPEEPDAEDEGE
jgi:hypothetical protein